ncbi:regulator of microtubule dynamics protein 1-like [Daktulosphaira vitifoliae]|uniref:regulator of microtubule dynamics protein 1-like n=1 Tax=Daktulosphaira vitifoliae TaxID=58002 RepID=UPI0021AA43D1|nr:regulator of microtubule dynamics protein 1-like [Daktulosphaira vitifoliae]
MLVKKVKLLQLFTYEVLINVFKNRNANFFFSVNGRPNITTISKVELKKILCFTMPFFGYTATQENTQSNIDKKPNIKDKLAEADRLFLEDKYEDVVNILEEYKNLNDEQVLWRIGRAYYNMSRCEKNCGDKRKNLIMNAHELIKKALSINPNIFEVQKWAAVLIDEYCSIIGIKERIKSLEIVKSHMERALELNPKDPTIRYMIGYWCYSVADMPWYQRQIASSIFGATLPTATYEEALEHFKSAETLQPLFYSKNLLMLGKTLLKMESKFSAEYYLKMVTQYPAKTVDDLEAKKEADKILKSSFGYY